MTAPPAAFDLSRPSLDHTPLHGSGFEQGVVPSPKTNPIAIDMRNGGLAGVGERSIVTPAYEYSSTTLRLPLRTSSR